MAAAPAAAGLAVAVVTPRQVRDFARATGRPAKADALDPGLLAPVGERVRPAPRPLPDATAAALGALVARRRPPVARRTAERNRPGTAPPEVRAGIAEHVRRPDARGAAPGRGRARAIRGSPRWRAEDDLRRGAEGVGPVLSATLLAGLPELGTLGPEQPAAPVGVAPLNRDSGRRRGTRTGWGGRAAIRAALDMGTLAATRSNPAIRAFDRRLLARGKAKKVALTACMRQLLTILNALARHQTYRQPSAAQAA